MHATLVCLRADLRSRGRAFLLLALLVGVAAGGVGATALGAYRTGSAYDRFLTDGRASDVFFTEAPCPVGDELAPGEPPFDCDASHMLALPQVEDAAPVTFYEAGVRASGGQDVGALFGGFPGLVVVRPDGGTFGRDVNKTKVLEGRLAAAPNEALVGVEVAERAGIEVGDELLLSLSAADPADPDPVYGSRIALEPARLRVVGVGVSPGEIAPASGSGFLALIHLSAAFDPVDEAISGKGHMVRLRRGDTTADLIGEMERRRILIGDYGTQSDFTVAIKREIRPQAAALAALAVAGGLAVLAILGQLVARELARAARDHRTLADIGFDRRDLLSLGLARSALIASVAGLVSVAVATALSPLAPLGVARVAEPHPGLSAPLVGSLAAGLITAVLVVAVAAPSVWRGANAVAGADRSRRTIDMTQRVSLPPVPATGLRFALGRGIGSRRLPVWTSLIGTAFGVSAMAAALVFATSLGHLLSTPRLTGWNWDATIAFPALNDKHGTRLDPDEVRSALADDPDVEKFSFGTIGQPFVNYLLRVGPDRSLVEMMSSRTASGPR